MSLTGGHDLAIAIAGPAIRALILKQLPEQLPIKGPVQIGPVAIPLTLNGKTGTVTLYAVLRKLTPQMVDANGTPTLRFQLRYDRASLSGAMLPKQVCPIAGTLTIDAAITVASTPIGGSTNVLQQAQVDFSAANFTNSFDDNSVEAAVPGGGAAIGAAMAGALKQLLIMFAPNGGVIPVGPAIPLNPKSGGSLSPLVVTAFRLRAINGGLVLFMNLDGSTRNAGDPKNKVALDLPANRNIALQMSAGCFHRQVFCPGLAKQFKVPVASLPTSCGNAGSVGYYVAQADETIDIKRLGDTFQQGRIVVDGTFGKSGFCYDLNGGFTGQITFPSGIVPKFDLVNATSDLDVPWYCKVVAAVIGTLTGGALFGAMTFLGVEIAESAVDNAISKQLKNGFDGLGLPAGALGSGAFTGASFDTAIVTAEGLSIGGTLPAPAIPWTDVTPGMSLDGAISTTNTQLIEQGTVKKKTPCTLEKDYPYTLQSVSETAAYDVTLQWVVQPMLSTEWRILIPNAAWTAAQVIPLSGTGVATLSQVDTIIPNLNGPVKGKADVTVAYTATADGITLTNLEPQKGGYGFQLEAVVTLCGGETKSVQRGIAFQGMVLDILGFDQDVNDCTTKWYKAIKAAAGRFRLERVPTILEKVDMPPPERFRQFFETMVRHGRQAGADTPELAAMLAAGHVGSMARATLHAEGLRTMALAATSDAGIRAASQARFDAANAALATAQSAVDGAQQQLADAQQMAVDVRLSLAGGR